MHVLWWPIFLVSIHIYSQQFIEIDDPSLLFAQLSPPSLGQLKAIVQLQSIESETIWAALYHLTNDDKTWPKVSTGVIKSRHDNHILWFPTTQATTTREVKEAQKRQTQGD